MFMADSMLQLLRHAALLPAHCNAEHPLSELAASRRAQRGRAKRIEAQRVTLDADTIWLVYG